MDIIQADKSGQPLSAGLYTELQSDILSGAIPNGSKLTEQAICKKYNVKACVAHNATFDYRATSKTQRYVTKSKYRWFLPYGVELWDTMKMANDTICKQVHYKEWCYTNGYMTKNGRVRKTAEILYKYISGERDFKESHTGLEDVMIEKEIFAHCIRQV